MIATPTLLALPTRDLETLVTALRSSRLGPNAGAAELQAFFGQAWAAQIAADLRVLATLGFSGPQLACNRAREPRDRHPPTKGRRK
jgi:hypothetical protein